MLNVCFWFEFMVLLLCLCCGFAVMVWFVWFRFVTSCLLDLCCVFFFFKVLHKWSTKVCGLKIHIDLTSDFWLCYERLEPDPGLCCHQKAGVVSARQCGVRSPTPTPLSSTGCYAAERSRLCSFSCKPLLIVTVCNQAGEQGLYPPPFPTLGY